METIIHSDDILLLEYWEKALEKNCTVIDDIEELFSFENSLLIVNYTALGNNYESIVEKLQSKNNLLLVLDRTANIKKAKEFLKLSVKGYGNALMKEHFIVSAVDTIKEGMIWLYPAFTTMLIQEISSTDKSADVDWSSLTNREKGVALLLKEGIIYKDIGSKLNIKPRTVKAHAKSIYTKLGVKDRLSLALLIK